MRDSAGQLARGINILAGIWLFVSAFVLPHERAMFTNTWVVGIVVMILAIIAMGRPVARYLNTLIAIWLFISAFALAHVSVAPVWNNAIVAVIVFVISLIPQATTAPATTQPDAGHRIQPPQQPQAV